ncbi:lipopolysaccharide export system ATP-binding protein [Hydrogenivirga caldilitoris]|uniref:Lipopolysaccharide export system ATP-binding protein n=1 Tax=Hydrogenivirga caldilitoris TaxID=246264 RepID=A0A497XV18_9AQUI|nr:LPS export ABC transporter ATP-binding protein [Hydrogenivirga caldilitoris]RLJ71002.1 lipopolysaccharide export system ATP-binding protein [Hydrogenivirga caldilitoris]
MLRAKNLKKNFKGRKVIKNVSLRLERGEVVGLLGPNGAGKTTLFNSLVGFVKVDGGVIEIDGEDITHLPPHERAKKGIAFLPQEHTLFEDLTVIDNLLIFLEFFTDSWEEAVTRAEALLEDFGLLSFRNQKAYTLSGGQKRRLEIARSLITKPKYIFFDEPFAGLDPIIVSDIRKMVRDLKHQDIGILITDHNVRETISIVDRVYIISEGKIIAKGHPSDVVELEDVRKTYLGEDFRL